MLQNIDHYFDYPQLTGAINQDITCVLKANKDSNQGGLNGGLMLIQPNRSTYQDLITLLNNGNPWRSSDQEILDVYFSSKRSLFGFPQEEATFARCCMTNWFDRKKLRVVHFTHFALDFAKIIKEDVNENHYKNWKQVPNCDVDFYKAWKMAYHQAVS